MTSSEHYVEAAFSKGPECRHSTLQYAASQPSCESNSAQPKRKHQKSDRGELAVLYEYFVSISQLANISNFYGVPFSWLLIAF